MQLTESIIKKQCHDCGSKNNLKHLVYEEDRKEIDVYKCEECFEKSESLSNYKRCECYSRIVGYLRPVRDWNKAKSLEFEERETFTR